MLMVPRRWCVSLVQHPSLANHVPPPPWGGPRTTGAARLVATGVYSPVIVGPVRLGSLHVNDSKTALGSNVDRHAPLGTGELGRGGCATFLSEPRFEDLPAIFEGPGIEGKAPAKADVDLMRELREEGLAARR